MEIKPTNKIKPLRTIGLSMLGEGFIKMGLPIVKQKIKNLYERRKNQRRRKKLQKLMLELYQMGALYKLKYSSGGMSMMKFDDAKQGNDVRWIIDYTGEYLPRERDEEKQW